MKYKSILIYAKSLMIAFGIVLIQINGQITLPYSNNYIIPSQSWFFITEQCQFNNTLIQYNWTSNINIQSIAVSEDDYFTLLDLDLFSRAAYFEALIYIEGIFDSGKITTTKFGEVFFVFFNPNKQQANLELNLYEYSNFLPPWVLGILIAIFSILFFLGLAFIAMKIRQSMIRKAKVKLTPEQRYLQ